MTERYNHTIRSAEYPCLYRLRHAFGFRVERTIEMLVQRIVTDWLIWFTNTLPGLIARSL